MRFLLGFLAASALWGSAGFLYVTGRLDGLLALLEPETAAAADEATQAEDEGDSERIDKKRRRRLKRARLARERRRQRQYQGSGTAGDDIGWDDNDRRIDMAAGEEQLSGPEIDAGFDQVMGRVRRCLVLVPTDGDVTGKLTFGMRVGSNGSPKAVNLSGPSVVVKSEAGACLRDAAKAIRFASFDGPDMLFKYPITLE